MGGGGLKSDRNYINTSRNVLVVVLMTKSIAQRLRKNTGHSAQLSCHSARNKEAILIKVPDN